MSTEIMIVGAIVEAKRDRFAELEEQLFCFENDWIDRDEIVKGAYVEASRINAELPSLEDLMQHVYEYNNEITFEMDDIELALTCMSCTERFLCYANGDTTTSPLKPDKHSDCEGDASETVAGYCGSNYNIWELEKLVLMSVINLGYGCIISSEYFDWISEEELCVYCSKQDVVFNDCQTLILPEMNPEMGTGAIYDECTLLLTGSHG